jgi:hypothetical protein
MAATRTFRCICGIEKKTSNHWILATHTPSSLTFAPWDTNLALRDDVIVLCGEGCATALLSRSLGEWVQPAFSDDAGELVGVVATNGSPEVVSGVENVEAGFTVFSARDRVAGA